MKPLTTRQKLYRTSNLNGPPNAPKDVEVVIDGEELLADAIATVEENDFLYGSDVNPRKGLLGNKNPAL